MAFIAIDEASGEMLGVVRLHANADYDTRRIRRAGPLRPQGPRARLAADAAIIEYARAEGLRTIEGQVLGENTAMLDMCRELGFDIAADPQDADTHRAAHAH